MLRQYQKQTTLLLLSCILYATVCSTGVNSFVMATAAAISPFGIAIPFVGVLTKTTTRKESSTTTTKTSYEKNSLEEFNALCQQAIDEERQMHYYAYVMDAYNRKI